MTLQILNTKISAINLYKYKTIHFLPQNQKNKYFIS